MNAPQREFIPNNLVWAILTTLFCCLPLGVVSIVYAAQVDGKAAAGDIAGARAAANSAKSWAIASAVIAPVLAFFWILFAGGMTMLGALFGAH